MLPGPWFLSKDTHEALIFTCASTAACVRYLLLERNLQFVSTRKFSTYNIERMFGAIRSMGEGNNKCDVASATFAINKILRTNICHSSIHSNVPIKKDEETTAYLLKEPTNSGVNGSIPEGGKPFFFLKICFWSVNRDPVLRICHRTV